MREALRKRQREVTALQRRIVTRELTPMQKKVAGKIPQAEVVTRIGFGKTKAGEVKRVAGRATFGEANLPVPVRLAQFALRAEPKRTIKLTLRAKGGEAPLRHELAHQVLNLQDISSKEHHPIIKKAVASKKKGVSFRLLEPARTAIRRGATTQAAEPRFRQAQFRELRRRARRRR
jgi:hypothetical protein